MRDFAAGQGILTFFMVVIFRCVELVFPHVWGHEELWGQCTELLRCAEMEIPWFRVCWWVGGGGMSMRGLGGWTEKYACIYLRSFLF